MDPADGTNNSGFALTALYLVFDRLISLAPDGTLAPDLATSWKFVDGSSTDLELQLRTGVTFHDGQKFDAAAVKANFDRDKQLGSKANFTLANAVDQIKSMEITDAQTIHLHLAASDPGFPYNLAVQAGMMISPAAITAHPGLGVNAVGTGPYKMTDYVSHDHMTATRYAGYWDNKVNTRPAQVQVSYVSNSQTRLGAVQSGQADIAIIDPSQLDQAKSAELQTQINKKNSIWTIYTNLDGPLKDARVRQAFMSAVDRDALAKAFAFGTGEATDQLFPPSSPAFVSDLANLYPYDPAKAKQLLAEAGYPNGVTLETQVGNTNEYLQLDQALQAMVAKAGFKLKFDVIDISQASRFQKGKGGDIYPGRGVPRPDPFLQLQEIVGPGAAFTPGGTASPKLDQLLGTARTFALDDPKRMEAIQAANRESTEQAAVFPLFTRANIYVFKTGCVKNFDTVVNSGADDFRNATLSKGCKG